MHLHHMTLLVDKFCALQLGRIEDGDVTAHLWLPEAVYHIKTILPEEIPFRQVNSRLPARSSLNHGYNRRFPPGYHE